MPKNYLSKFNVFFGDRRQKYIPTGRKVNREDINEIIKTLQESQNHFTENFVPPALLMALKKGKIKG